MMGWNGWGGFGPGGILSLILMAGFWILVVVGIVLVVRALTGPRQGTGAAPSLPHPLQQMPMASQAGTPPVAATTGGSEALRILEERYARGDIEREEFLQRKADLGG
ncbi:MAG: SHOCT domain-containing protein [Thermoleophilia bacterium]